MGKGYRSSKIHSRLLYSGIFYESDDEICMCLDAVETIKKAVNEFVNKTEETTGEVKAF